MTYHQNSHQRALYGPNKHITPVVLVVRDAGQSCAHRHHEAHILQEVTQEFGTSPHKTCLQVDLQQWQTCNESNCY